MLITDLSEHRCSVLKMMLFRKGIDRDMLIKAYSRDSGICEDRINDIDAIRGYLIRGLDFDQIVRSVKRG